MTGASFTSSYLFDSGAGGPGETGAVASRSVIKIRVIGSWLFWLVWGWYAHSQL